MTEATALLERHRAFWLHQDGGQPLVRRRPCTPRRPFHDMVITPGMLDVEELTPAIGTRDQADRLVQGDLFRTVEAFGRIPWMEAIVGCPIHAGADEAMWPRPALGPAYEGIERIVPRPDNPWLGKLLALSAALVAANDGSYLVTHTLLRGPMDILSALLGDVRMGEGLYLEPERIQEVLGRAAEAFIQVARAQHALIPPFEGGRACWAYGLWAPGTVIRFQSDSASQLSPTMYREQILPHDRTVMQAFDHSIIDLHSGGTLHLYPVLLEVDELDAISITLDPYASAPSLPDLLPTFRTILERKSLSIAGAMTPDQVDWLRRALPTGCLAISA